MTNKGGHGRFPLRAPITLVILPDETVSALGHLFLSVHK